VSDVTRILGIDPGSQVMGFGLVDARQRGNEIRLIGFGAIRTKGEHITRLRQIFEKVGRVVTEFAPDEVAVERVFVHRNADSALKLGQARAAALCATFEADLPVFEYAARHIKKAVVGRGSADKTQVQHMVKLMLGMESEPQADAADALAAALCHAHARSARSLLDEVAVRS
jgi:crossover junction endodeoxyribonuclease RuvC